MSAVELRAMLAIPRPRTREDCRSEARPCPWVGCRHHLALEVASTKVQRPKEPRPTSILLNRPRPGLNRTIQGRRPGLHGGAAVHLVRQWIEDAVLLVASARETCVLDVVEKYPDGLTSRALAILLGVTVQAVEKELRVAAGKFRAGLAAHAPEGSADFLGPEVGTERNGR